VESEGSATNETKNVTTVVKSVAPEASPAPLKCVPVPKPKPTCPAGTVPESSVPKKVVPKPKPAAVAKVCPEGTVEAPTETI
jgi:hypothetical protein